MLARRLLLSALGGGSFPDMGYTMSAAETAWWQDQAAMLDPDAYELVIGTNQTRTVPGGENWYVISAWYIVASGGGAHWFNRPSHTRDAHPVPEGTVLTTRVSSGDGVLYICKPALVVSGDARYTDDPRALYWDRIRRIQTELTQYQIGATVTDGSQPTVAFPTDFTNGLLIHASMHDVAWATLINGSGHGATGGLNEISDSDRVRFAEPNLVPFKRTAVPSMAVQGASQSEGRATFTYVKLPGDW